jgi:hypothetical protein
VGRSEKTLLFIGATKNPGVHGAGIGETNYLVEPIDI